MAAARAAGLPVPEVHAAGVWQDLPALLITWLAGRTVADELRVRPWRVWRAGVAVWRVQGAAPSGPPPPPPPPPPTAGVASESDTGPTSQHSFPPPPPPRPPFFHPASH